MFGCCCCRRMWSAVRLILMRQIGLEDTRCIPIPSNTFALLSWFWRRRVSLIPEALRYKSLKVITALSLYMYMDECFQTWKEQNADNYFVRSYRYSHIYFKLATLKRSIWKCLLEERPELVHFQVRKYPDAKTPRPWPPHIYLLMDFHGGGYSVRRAATEGVNNKIENAMNLSQNVTPDRPE